MIRNFFIKQISHFKSLGNTILSQTKEVVLTFASCKMDPSTPQSTSSSSTPSAGLHPSQPTSSSSLSTPTEYPPSYPSAKAPPPLPPTYLTSTQELPPPPTYTQDPQSAQHISVQKPYVYRRYCGLRMTSIICFAFFGLAMIGSVVLVIVLSATGGF